MEEFLHTLYAYAQENRVPRYLRTPEYRRAACGLEEGWEMFRSTLTTEQKRKLDILLLQEWEVGHLEDEASFAAALSIGLDLSRL